MRRPRNLLTFLPAAVLLVALLTACNASKFVPDGQYLLDKVSLQLDDTTETLETEQLKGYIRQFPNHKILWSAKLQLGIYNLSGRDSTKRFNRFIRRLGEAPVIYDSTLTMLSANQLRQAMVNRGFLSAEVEVDTILNPAKKRAEVTYNLTAGPQHIIRNIDYNFPNDTLRQLVMADSALFAVREGDPLDRNALEAMRDRIMRLLRSKGYYAFAKEYITFNADTTEGSLDVDLTMTLNPPYAMPAHSTALPSHALYRVRNVWFVTNYDPVRMTSLRDISAPDTIHYRDIGIFCDKKPYLRPSVLYENCYIRAGQLYDDRDVNRTYQALSRLGILKFVNIRFEPIASLEGQQWLDAYILLTPDKSQSITLEIEGTNSEGDLGVAAGVTYTHRNLGRGSETFTGKLRGAYESLSGNLEGLLHNRYMEYSAEATISYPKFLFPFVRESFKRKIRATTHFNASLNYQERPEYTRIIGTAGWGYRWSEPETGNRHTFTLLDINYVYLPESTNDFINQIAPDNPLLRYSYEDHFIMRLGYSFYHTNKRPETPWTRGLQSDIWTLRVNAETAGNLLFALSNIFAHRSDFRENPYKVFGIRYSQYVKAEGDFTWTHIFNHRNSLALHAGVGVAYPYGNSSVMPFEKRFYGGGANGVRGWDVRTLGPGSFQSRNSVSDFMDQCGDIRLDLNVEYRAKLFWVVELGAFIDAGNIWTIHNYENQPGGMFHFNKFYKQLAAAYGLGIRLDFNYFLLRFDLGMKAHNPAEGEEKWPLLHPNWHRDSSFHFSIGYPF